MSNQSRVLVTGGNGFIGRRLVCALLKANVSVVVADKYPFPNKDVESVVGDLRDPKVVSRAVRPGIETVFHLAAITSVLESVKDPDGAFQLNVSTTEQLLERARTRNVHSFLFASSNAVAGNVGTAKIEEQTALRPLTPYGATKAAGEMLLSSYTACYGLKGCSLRFSNVYGPGMAEKDSFVPRLMRAARDGRGIQVYGDGKQVRDLVYVDDIISGIFIAWQAEFVGPLILGAGTSISVNEMISSARSITNSPIPAEYIAAKPGEMPAVIIDISLARSIGYKPQVDFRTGLSTVWPEFSKGSM